MCLKAARLEGNGPGSWQPRPVFHMSFNGPGHSKEGAFEEKLEAMLGKWEAQWGTTCQLTSPGAARRHRSVRPRAELAPVCGAGERVRQALVGRIHTAAVTRLSSRMGRRRGGSWRACCPSTRRDQRGLRRTTGVGRLETASQRVPNTALPHQCAKPGKRLYFLCPLTSKQALGFEISGSEIAGSNLQASYQH